MGFPLGKGFKATSGAVQALQDFDGVSMMDLSASVDPGNSGGPVLNANGQVVGIVTAKIMFHNFNLALPLDTILGYLEAAQNPVSLTVTSEPTGSRIFATGNYLGKTPFSFIMHNRSLVISVEADGYEPLKRTIKAGEIPEIAENFILLPKQSAKVLVSFTVPEGAKIYIDNTLVATGSQIVACDPNSKIRIKVTLSGHKDMFFEKRLSAEVEQSIHVDLKTSTWK
jgi:hypothetical protein